MREPNDWRLMNQERYLRGATLVWQRYLPAKPTNDHDHCEFCQTKFMQNDPSGRRLFDSRPQAMDLQAVLRRLR